MNDEINEEPAMFDMSQSFIDNYNIPFADNNEISICF